jgi:hypothetical protein
MPGWHKAFGWVLDMHILPKGYHHYGHQVGVSVAEGFEMLSQHITSHQLVRY